MGVRESVSARGVWRERATVADVVVTTTVGAWARAWVRVVVVFRGRVFRA